MSYAVIGHIDNEIRMVRRHNGSIVAERWNDTQGNWAFMEQLAPHDAAPAAQAAACNAFRRRILDDAS